MTQALPKTLAKLVLALRDAGLAGLTQETL
jgi:hypothetical protein